MARPRLLPLAAALLTALPVGAAPEVSDPTLDRLVTEALAASPDLARARALVAAEAERVGPAGTPGDPVLSLGIQNDGFGGLQIGKMETSFWQVMITQPVPWPGKLGLRQEVARLSARQAATGLERARLSLEADVRRAYLDLLLVRDRLALLERREALWIKAEGMARARYETGDGAQSDLLRAQLERTRLRQRRAGLQGQERTAVQALDRLRSRPLGEPVPTHLSIADLGAPAPIAEAAAQAEAEQRSPELAAARLGLERSARTLDLARRDRWPDLSVTAAVMPRGAFEPMWQAGVSVSLPVFSASKQWRSVAEQESRLAAETGASEATVQVVRQRTEERRITLDALLETIRLYQGGLLTQSRATAESTLAQYRVGRVTFVAVLEAVAGTLADEEAYLETLAEAHRVAIAAREVSLASSGGAAAGGRSGAMPGAGAVASSTGASSPGAAAPTASGGDPSSMTKM